MEGIFPIDAAMTDSSIAFPEFINQVAAAGTDGIHLVETSETSQALELAKAWGIDLRVMNGRIIAPWNPDSMIPAWIEHETMRIIWKTPCVAGFLQLASTNAEALRMAGTGSPEGLLVYAENQTEGRGRLGRRWYSQPGVALCFSLILWPRQAQQCWSLLTHSASVALVRTLRHMEREYSPETLRFIDLKWPNDVLIERKKVAGILLEVSRTSGGRQGVVLGIGINVSGNSVPPNLRDVATSVNDGMGATVPRRKLIVQFLNDFQDVYRVFEAGQRNQILEEWKSQSSMCTGAFVWIEEGTQRKAATTCGITDAGELRVRLSNGREVTILAADVRIRRNS